VEILSVIAFAAALSLDGFGVGVAYGMRKIRIPGLSLMVISLTSSTAIGITMLFGHLVAQYISAGIAETIGAAILILVGLWIVLQTVFKRKAYDRGLVNGENSSHPDGHCEPIFRLQIKGLGLVIQILHEPTAADWDKSGIINIGEALMLGLALALDAMGAGFGAAMAGFGPLLTPLIVGLVKFMMVSLGVHVGRRSASSWLGDRAAVLPGWVLICLGLARVMKI